MIEPTSRINLPDTQMEIGLGTARGSMEWKHQGSSFSFLRFDGDLYHLVLTKLWSRTEADGVLHHVPPPENMEIVSISEPVLQVHLHHTSTVWRI
jgi:hypothetical protein